jgi:hypothetical protein
MLPVEVGSKGLSTAQAHTIPAPLAEPIAIAILLVIAKCASLGILDFVSSYLTSQKNVLTTEQRIRKNRQEEYFLILFGLAWIKHEIPRWRMWEARY